MEEDDKVYCRLETWIEKWETQLNKYLNADYIVQQDRFLEDADGDVGIGELEKISIKGSSPQGF